ncbi:Origin recognition complex subunit 2 [Didymosphaeria variabile]|uniref:Origin recognition complex subunit 2 n=1 Tax=Didymosphaeria variabile TaxID=1932322 RepID=A0A9W9CBI1_9PLEO|nr:Origin recognition complex subunit 2 [Didymosphaeria variabile]KAJ4354022.1 Origin recognition complex subunit 2 [Didymosphaeria variabile]
MVSAKRKRDEQDVENTSPRKLRTQTVEDDRVSELEAQTPSRRGRGLVQENGTPRSILKQSGLRTEFGATPRSNRRLLFATPTKAASDETPSGTPTIVRNADRSARRKSNRKLIDRTINGPDSEDEALDEEDMLAQQILSEEEHGQDEEQDTEAGAQEAVPVPETPSKRPRGRPKGTGKNQLAAKARKEREPTPPNELPAHEVYFWQNRPGGTKTSNNTLPSHTLLNHDEYFDTMQSYADRHKPEKDFLLELHSRAYDQWIFELEEGFNICLYGYGSKRAITDEFTARIYQHLLDQAPYRGTKKTPKIAVINGYTPGVILKDILTTVASAAIPKSGKLPNQPASLLNYILDHLSRNPPPHPLLIVINSIDSANLRKHPTPAMLALLAAHPSINLVCTADTPNFPLLWDVGLRAQYKFLFHDATTFATYNVEIDTVETVNELLGRSGRRIGGRDGVGFVLKSLPEHARALFRIIVTEQLALAYMEDEEQAEDEELAATSKSKRNGPRAAPEATQGVEYRTLYHKARDEFVCTSEVAFRTLLKEFHDHQMIESRKDSMGTERLVVPFRQEELETLVEELAGGDAF